jgi:cytochrome c oxidase subunit 2
MIYNDTSRNYDMGFQDPGSDWMLAIIDLHDNIIFYLIILFTLIIWIFISAMLNKDHLAYLEHGNLIEIIWTITPAIILWAIGIPSLKLLYMMDEIIDAELTVKA